MERKYTVKDVIDKADEIFGFRNVRSFSHTEEQWAFKQKLFRLTDERKTKNTEECDNIDATAFLTTREYHELVMEALSLKKSE